MQPQQLNARSNTSQPQSQINAFVAGGALLLALLFFFIALPLQAATVYNQAQIRYSHPSVGLEQVFSNSVSAEEKTEENGPQPTISFYQSDQYQQTTGVTRVGRPLHIQVDGEVCNVDSTRIEQYTLHLQSQNTGDSERFTAIESGADTGIFRLSNVTTRDGQTNPVISNNQIVELTANDVITATLEGCSGASSVQANVLIDPFGVVFDSQSNRPVAGATVTLIDVDGAGNGGRPGQPAVVFAEDGVTPAPSTVITGADGAFQFPRVAASRYRLEITPPEGYAFPSTVAIGDLPAGRVILDPGSFGGIFEVSEDTGAVQLDVPLDPQVDGLLTTINATPQSVAFGDIVNVSVTATNFTADDLENGAINLSLPLGFSYIPGSITINGVAVADPVIENGQLVIPLENGLGQWAAGESFDVRFAAHTGAGATDGSIIAISSGQQGTLTVSSNTATEELRVSAAEFRGYLIGKVFADCDANRVQAHEEPGVSGVRLYLQDGSFVVTDEEGKFSFTSLDPRLHVLRLDTLTLPAGAALHVVDGRNAGDPTSRFIDLKNNEIQKANFAIIGCSDKLLSDIAERRNAGVVNGSDRVSDEYLHLRPVGSAQRVGDLPASGYFRADGSVEQGQNAVRQTQRIDPAQPANESTPETAAPSPQALLEGLTNRLGFVNLQPEQIMPSRQTNVVIKGRIGGQFFLSVNNQPIDDSRIGRRMTLPSTQLEVREYVALDLVAGDNLIELSVMDSFGNIRGSRSVVVKAPGELDSLSWEIPESATADGQSLLPIKITALDKHGLPIAGRLPATIHSTHGVWRTQDLEPLREGLQVMLENGRASLLLLPPLEPVIATLEARAGELVDRQPLQFKAEARPLMVVGLVEADIQWHDAGDNGNGLRFERQISQLTSELDDKTDAAIRGAVYARGDLTENLHLTLSYDSEKQRDVLNRDIQPDQDYAVWGDSAIKGFDARSSSALFLRLDRGTSWLQYGDFNSRSGNKHTDLGRYRRSLTGAQLHVDAGALTLKGFASRGRSTQNNEEIRGQGTSGPYLLANLPLENSEQIEIIVRDRDNPDDVIEERQLNRFVDYVLDVDSGEILLREPLPSVSGDELHPTFLRVAYETEGASDDYFVSGASAEIELGSGLSANARIVSDENPDEAFRLASLQLAWETGTSLSQQTRVVAEVAASNTELLGDGFAERLQLSHRSEALKLRLVASHSDSGFDNRSSTVRTGRSHLSADMSVALSEKTQLEVDAVWQADNLNDSENWGALLSLSRTLGNNTKVDIGTRYSDGDSHEEAQQTLRLAVSLTVPKLPKLSINASAEFNLNESDERLLAIGGSYRVNADTRVYLRHELASTLDNRFDLSGTRERNSTVVGLETKAWEGARLFSEYRSRDAFSGREAEAAMGLRNRWLLDSGVRIHTSLERIEALTDAASQTTTAVTTAADYTANPLWKLSGRLEYRDSGTAEQWLNTLGIARKLNIDWTVLGRSLLRRQTLHSTETSYNDEARIQLGLAWRQTHIDRWNMLSRYEWRYSNAHGGAIEEKDQRHLLQTHINWQPNGHWNTSAYLGSRWSQLASNAFKFDAGLHMLGGRVRYQVAERWDLGVVAAYASDYDQQQTQQSAGFEVGYVPAANLSVALGYNVVGFEVDDLDSGTPTRDGVYFTLRWKFDEHSFGGPAWKR